MKPRPGHREGLRVMLAHTAVDVDVNVTVGWRLRLMLALRAEEMLAACASLRGSLRSGKLAAG